jgi:hypothetical protein
VARRHTPEQDDLLTDILAHPGISVFLQEIDHVADQITLDVLKLNITDVSSERELLHRRLRADGALKLASAIKQRVQTLKIPKKDRK